MSKPHTTRVYKSNNGYEGILYGKPSFSVFDSDGNEILHTGNRTFNTYSELVDFIDGFPNIMQMIAEKLDNTLVQKEDSNK